MRHAGLVLAAFLLASVPAMAAGATHQAGGAHAEGNARFAQGGRPAHPAGGHLPVAEHECYSAAQTREKIAAHKLAEPFRLLIIAANRYEAEPLGVRLCRRKEQYIYEISLLRTNGRVIHVFTNAVTGQTLGVKNAK
jgi:hypothetical protein